MRNRVGAIADRGCELVAQVVDEQVVDPDHQVEERRAVAEHYPKEFGRLSCRVEDRINRDLQLLGRRMDARLGLAQAAPQLGRAMLDQLDENFVLSFKVQVESAEADVRFGGDVGDARLMVALARDDAFGRLHEIEARLFTSPIESIRSVNGLSSDCCHETVYDEK